MQMLLLATAMCFSQPQPENHRKVKSKDLQPANFKVWPNGDMNGQIIDL